MARDQSSLPRISPRTTGPGRLIRPVLKSLMGGLSRPRSRLIDDRTTGMSFACEALGFVADPHGPEVARAEACGRGGPAPFRAGSRDRTGDPRQRTFHPEGDGD